MNRIIKLVSVGIAAGFMLFGAKAAFAVPLPCDSTTGVPGNGECRITLPHALGTGVLNFEVDRTLHIDGGSLTVTPPSVLTLAIAGGPCAVNPALKCGLIMENFGRISGDTASGIINAATININVATGDVVLAASGAFITADNFKGGGCGTGGGGTINLVALGTGATVTTEDGSIISASALSAQRTPGNPNPSLGTCSAGSINISAPNQGAIDIDGDVLSESGRSGVGNSANSPKGGGPIFVDAACNLTVSDTGKISSLGQDPGADLVHLKAGCDVLIEGLVQSTGVGHVTPKVNGIPSNLCNSNYHPDKPLNTATGCVEVWAGNSLKILHDIPGHNGEINADTGGPGGSTGTSWIDLFARGDISILSSASFWAVHAMGNAGTDNGGVITVKTTGVHAPADSPGNIYLNGLALQASAVLSGQGGTVDVESILSVDLRALVGGVDGSIQAKGGNGAPSDHGGHIIILAQTDIRAGAGSNLNVTGHPNVAAQDGTIVLQACGSIDFPPGTTSAGAIIAKTPLSCPTPPVLQAYVVLPDCPCGGGTPRSSGCEKSTVNSVLNTVTGRFPGNAGPDLTFILAAGQDQDGNTSIQQSVDNVVDHNGDGYLIVMVTKDASGQLGGSTVQKVAISQAYNMTFALFGCSVTMIDPDKGDGLPTGLIAGSANSPNHLVPPAPGNIFVMDLHGAGSDVAGWVVVGDGRYMRNVATSTSAKGVWFQGNGNTMHNGNGNNNVGAGIYIDGNNNIVDSSDVFGNGGNGVTVVGGGNTIKKVDAGDKGKGNSGDGVNVLGDSNIISEVDAYANNRNGIKVAGNSNQLLKNGLGDRNKSNGLDGINLAGNSNKVQENEAYANGGNGINASGTGNSFIKNKAGDRGDKANKLDGFLLAGGSSLSENSAVGNLGNGFHFSTGGFSLLKNIGGGSGSGQPNGLCQFKFDAAGNTNSGQNKANNVTIVGVLAALLCK